MTLRNMSDRYGSISIDFVGHVLIGGLLLLHATAWAAEVMPPSTWWAISTTRLSHRTPTSATCRFRARSNCR